MFKIKPFYHPVSNNQFFWFIYLVWKLHCIMSEKRDGTINKKKKKRTRLSSYNTGINTYLAIDPHSIRPTPPSNSLKRNGVVSVITKLIRKPRICPPVQTNTGYPSCKTGYNPGFPICSHYLVCSKNNSYFVGIDPLIE